MCAEVTQIMSRMHLSLWCQPHLTACPAAVPCRGHPVACDDDSVEADGIAGMHM